MSAFTVAFETGWDAAIEQCKKLRSDGLADLLAFLDSVPSNAPALAAPPAGPEVPPWNPKDHANHPASYCEICQSHAAPAGTGGRR